MDGVTAEQIRNAQLWETTDRRNSALVGVLKQACSSNKFKQKQELWEIKGVEDFGSATAISMKTNTGELRIVNTIPKGAETTLNNVNKYAEERAKNADHKEDIQLERFCDGNDAAWRPDTFFTETCGQEEIPPWPIRPTELFTNPHLVMRIMAQRMEEKKRKKKEKKLQAEKEGKKADSDGKKSKKDKKDKKSKKKDKKSKKKDKDGKSKKEKKEKAEAKQKGPAADSAPAGKRPAVVDAPKVMLVRRRDPEAEGGSGTGAGAPGSAADRPAGRGATGNRAAATHAGARGSGGDGPEVLGSSSSSSSSDEEGPRPAPGGRPAPRVSFGDELVEEPDWS